MNELVIHTDRLGKRFDLANRRGLIDLREQVSEVVRGPFRRKASRSQSDTIVSRQLWALRDVSLNIRRGEVVGIMGRNGSGKTTLMKLLARISEPTEGSAEILGRAGTLLDVGAGLHGELSGAENIYLNAATHGMQRDEIRERFDEMVAFAELEKSIHQPLKYFSNGMCLRLAFTIATFVPSSVLLVDEVLAQADPVFQWKCLARMTASAGQGQVVLFVSHDMECIRAFCTRGIVFKEGRVVKDGPAADAVSFFTSTSIRAGAREEQPSPKAVKNIELKNRYPLIKRAARHDPILNDFELPLRAVYHPFGFSLEVLTNSRAVLAAAEESWGTLRQHFQEPPARLCVGILDDGSRECPPIPVTRGRQHLMTIMADTGNFAVCDMRNGFAYCWLSLAVVENPAYLRYYFLEAAGPTLITYLYMTPLHAACVELNGRGVLLCGDSGAGKSSLAFACARRGWTFLSDDASAVVRKRKGRVVIGSPHRIRFRESAAELFPELENTPVITRATGEHAIEVSTSTLAGIKTGYETEIEHIVFLERSKSGTPSLSEFPKAAARKSFEHVICYGEEEVRDAQTAALDNLLTAEILELRYQDLDWAVDRLEALVGQGRERSRMSTMP